MPRKRKSPHPRSSRIAKRRKSAASGSSGPRKNSSSETTNAGRVLKPDSLEEKAEVPYSKSDEIGAGRSYFESYRGVVKTTNLTLASLSIAPAARLEAALAGLKDPFELEEQRLQSQVQNRFSQFTFMLAADHSLLFYGYGSKRMLLENLAEFLSSSHSVLVVSGFNPTLSLRATLLQLASDILKLTDFPRRTLIDYVDAIRNGMRHDRVALVIHNIDGPSFRSAEAQHALSTLATVQGISIIASIDHVNAPLLWDGTAYSRYEWAWIKADTYKSYTAETIFCSKALLRGRNERRVEGAVALLKSLSERACSTFRELARKQTDHGATPGTGAPTRLTFNQLFEMTKRKFLVSDPATLRMILTELETHDLLQRRRGADMTEQLWIPLDSSQLQQVLSQIDVSN